MSQRPTGQGSLGESNLTPCDPQYKIICEGLSARNRRSESDQCTDIFFAGGEDPPFDRWRLKCFRDSLCYGIRNDGSGNWATARGDKVLGCPHFDEKASKWRIEFVRWDKCRILQCQGELAWTKINDVVYLEEFHDQPNQLFEIAFIGRDLFDQAPPGGETVKPGVHVQDMSKRV